MKKINIDEELFLEMYENGKTDLEIATVFNCSRACIGLYRKSLKLPTRFTYKSRLSIDEIKELVIKGISDYEIAKIVQANHATIYQFRIKHGISRESLLFNLPVLLTDRQKSILVGHIFGDGCLKKKDNTNTSGVICQGEKQKEYAEWKYQELSNLCTTPLQLYVRKTPDKRNGNIYSEYRAHISANPELNCLYEAFYINNRKSITQSSLKFYDSLSLAVHFMDDGYLASSGGYYLATNCFSLEQCRMFGEFLFDKFDLFSSVHKGNKTYISAKSAERFNKLVSPYIIPSMQYKLHVVT